ncbi:hypothetical protein LQ567_24310 [Niabella pedocola]|uniref:Lipoprotein n=1 Tax=Niabella pedocola TaxID=1752077 RepID=A0ABS8PYQ1_9BACT|nr:hypothetical protein [Niabella pedocola]MCD2425929.1 hypothetical protein [Niabella pedocola]
MSKGKGKQGYKYMFFLVMLFGYCNGKGPHNNAETVRLQLFSFEAGDIGAAHIFEDTLGFKGKILLTNWKDTIFFNFGYGDVDNLAEKDPKVIYYPYNIDTLKLNIDKDILDTSLVIYTNKANYDIDEFRRRNVFFDSISGFRAKIVLPREVSKGGTAGVYFDSLRNDEGGRLKFNFYADNLDSLQIKRISEIIKTIRFNLNL